MASNIHTTRNSGSTIPPVNELSSFTFNLNYLNVNPPSKVSTCKKCGTFSYEFNLCGEQQEVNIYDQHTSIPALSSPHYEKRKNFTEAMFFNLTNNFTPPPVQQPKTSTWCARTMSTHLHPQEIAGSDY